MEEKYKEHVICFIKHQTMKKKSNWNIEKSWEKIVDDKKPQY